MKLYTAILTLLISVSVLQVSAQDKNQRVRDNDQVFIIDIRNVDEKTVGELNTIRFASVLEYTEGEKLILKASKDQSAKASKSIVGLLEDKALLVVKKGADYSSH